MKSFRIPNKKLEIIEKLYVGVHMYFLEKKSPNFYQITMEMVHPFMKKIQNRNPIQSVGEQQTDDFNYSLKGKYNIRCY